jgi:hypothetical protein
MKITIAFVAAAFLVVGCGQQASADLAVCKSDLGKAQADATTAKTASDQKISALEAQVKQAQDELAALQKANTEAAQAATDKTAADAKTAADKTAAGKATVAKAKAETKKEAEKADVKVTAPTKDMTVQEKAKASGF